MMLLYSVAVVSWLVVSDGYHILTIQSGMSRSHYNLLAEINNILLRAGHEVTFITTFPDPNPPKNLHYIDVSPLNEHWEDLDFTNLDDDIVHSGGNWCTSWILNLTAVQETLVSTQFDAVLSEWLFSDLNAGYAAVQQIPWIVLCGTVLHPEVQRLVDYPDIAAFPTMMSGFLPPMNIFYRLWNTITYLSVTWKFDAITDELYNASFAPIARARGVALPAYHTAKTNVSLLLLNSHPSYAPAVNLPPNAVEVGGYHVPEEIPALPTDLQTLLDESTHGVIYFSLGSIIRADMLHGDTIRELVDVFKNMSQTVLWKLDGTVHGVPKNVHIRSWMPQTSILAHPNVKVFITHSGMLGTIEAVKFGVPLISIPSFVDQHLNARRAATSGYALEVKFSPTMAKDVSKALQKILSDDSYSRRAKEMSALFKDRPVDPKILVLHYIELIIKTKGASHLRLSYDLSWYEMLMLDQVAFLLLLICIAFYQLRKFKNYVMNSFRKIKHKKQYDVVYNEYNINGRILDRSSEGRLLTCCLCHFA